MSSSAAGREWRELLTRFSALLLADDDVREKASAEAVRTGWLGEPPASAAQIDAAERRLGRALPPSYRAFLTCSNGWPARGLRGRLWPVEQVAWFVERHEDWIEAWEDTAGGSDTTDADYFVYGREQDACSMRTAYLRTALEIGEENDGAIVLLNPAVVFEDGEWEAWMFANWLPGAVRHRSFWDLMNGEVARAERKLERPVLHANRTWKSLKSAHGLAVGGQTDDAIEALEALAVGGDRFAAAWVAELHAFRSAWAEVLVYGCQGLAEPQVWNAHGHTIAPYLVRLIQQAGHETGRWGTIEKLANVAVTACDGPIKMGLHGNRALLDYARRCGAPPHRLIEPNDVEAMSPAERRAAYEAHLRVTTKGRPSKEKYPDRYSLDRFHSARFFDQVEEAVGFFEENPAAFRESLDAAIYVAREYVRRGRTNDAWSIVSERIANPYYPGEYGSVAPIALLAEPELAPLMTPERRAWVLATPRGEALER